MGTGGLCVCLEQVEQRDKARPQREEEEEEEEEAGRAESQCVSALGSES